MVLTKQELIESLQSEVRILLHLANKVDPAKVDYRPTPKQRSTLELLRYLAVMGPSQLEAIKAGVYDRPTLSAIWTPAIARSEAMDLAGTIAAIGEQSELYAKSLSEWTDEDFRSEVTVFGNKVSRGWLLVNTILTYHAAYRMQLFLYLKSCGRDELSTVDLWFGLDKHPAFG